MRKFILNTTWKSSNKFLFSSNASSPRFTVSLFQGDGIGPEISQSMMEVFAALKVPIDWQLEHILKEKVNEEGDLITAETLQNLRKNKYALKGKNSFKSI